jgi:5-methylcytosine-specific restriction enzyme A
MTLRRACLGCGKLGRWRTRCPRCQAQLDRRRAAARPDLHNDAGERRRRAAAVAEHRLRYGDWCPGYHERPGRPAHPSADLTADHAGMVGLGHDAGGPLVVRCRSCNSARAAAIMARELGGFPHGDQPTTPRPSKFATHSTAAAGRSESGARSCPGPSAPPGYCSGDCPGCPWAAMDAMGRSREHPTLPEPPPPVVA